MRFFLVAILFVFLNAKQTPTDLGDKSIVYLFKHNYYSYLCTHRWKYINQYLGKREDLLSVVAYACLKKHYLTYALDLAKNLRYTKEGRANSTYIISLFTIKNFLARYILDNFDLTSLKLPDIESDDLGKVFNLVKIQKPKIVNNKILLKNNDLNISVNYNLKTNEIIIKFFKNGELIKKDRYW